MQQRKSKKILIYFFLLLIVGSINNINLNNLSLKKISNISITGLNNLNEKNMMIKIQNLDLENIFYLKKNEINEVITSNTLVESYNVFKKYPTSLDIKIKKTDFIAKTSIEGKLYLIGANGKLSEIHHSNENLPFIFGKPEINEVIEFKGYIDQSKFSYNEINNLYFYPSKRWDIELKNKVIIKLSKERIDKSLNNAFEFINNNSIENIKLIDVRIDNQVILNG